MADEVVDFLFDAVAALVVLGLNLIGNLIVAFGFGGLIILT